MDILDALNAALGLDAQAQDLTTLQTVLRACVVFVYALLLVKVAKKRFMGQSRPFDFVIIIILGSVLSRAINGTAAFFPTLAAGFALVMVHRGISWCSTHFRRFGRFVEGEAKVLASNGKIDWDTVRRHDFTKEDLASAVRQQLNSDDLAQARSIVLEPNGKLSVVKK
jgi:uncharacterized membrane protein YcaP (DUF421 family)